MVDVLAGRSSAGRLYAYASPSQPYADRTDQHTRCANQHANRSYQHASTVTGKTPQGHACSKCNGWFDRNTWRVADYG